MSIIVLVCVAIVTLGEGLFVCLVAIQSFLLNNHAKNQNALFPLLVTCGCTELVVASFSKPRYDGAIVACLKQQVCSQQVSM